MTDNIPHISIPICNDLRVESWAGAATKVSGYIGMVNELVNYQDYKPDIIVGVSSGSIAGLLRIVTMIKPSSVIELEKMAKGFSSEDIFNKNPLTKGGKLNAKAILRGLIGKHSFGEHKRLTETLSSLFTKDIYREYVNGDYPDLLICSTSIDTGEYIISNAKDMDYDSIMYAILASTAIPGLMKNTFVGSRKIMDGGIRYSNAGWYVIYKLINKGYQIESHNSFYSRPQDISQEINESLKLDKKTFFRAISSIVGRSIKIMMFQNSKFCEFTEQQLAEKEKYKLNQFFLPKILSSSMDMNEDNLTKLYESGKSSLGDFDKKL